MTQQKKKCKAINGNSHKQNDDYSKMKNKFKRKKQQNEMKYMRSRKENGREKEREEEYIRIPNQQLMSVNRLQWNNITINAVVCALSHNFNLI